MKNQRKLENKVIREMLVKEVVSLRKQLKKTSNHLNRLIEVTEDAGDLTPLQERAIKSSRKRLLELQNHEKNN